VGSVAPLLDEHRALATADYTGPRAPACALKGTTALDHEPADKNAAEALIFTAHATLGGASDLDSDGVGEFVQGFAADVALDHGDGSG
jgi:hypothetical protein